MDNLNSQQSSIGDRLRLAREMAGLSQNQVAKKLGLHRPSVTEMEAGRRKVTSEELALLSQIYKVSVSWLTNTKNDDSDIDRDRVELAARELAKLKPEDLDRVLQLLSAMRREK